MGARRFEDLTVWRDASQLSRLVFALTAGGAFEHDWSFRDQLRSCADAIPANIAEGFGRFRPADFARFVLIARASAMELQSHLYAAQQRGWIDEQTAREIRRTTERTVAGLTRLHRYLRQCPSAGPTKRPPPP